MEETKVKKAKLRADEFDPSKEKHAFWQVPQQIARIENLSMGAKLLYGVLLVRAGKYGTAYPSQATLREYLGNISAKTLYNWQRELTDINLIRVHQKGRGLPNNYYLLRTPVLHNDPNYPTEEKDFGVYTINGDGQSIKLLLPIATARSLFLGAVEEWFNQRINGNIHFPFPTPLEKVSKREYNKIKLDAEAKVAAFIQEQETEWTHPVDVDIPF